MKTVDITIFDLERGKFSPLVLDGVKLTQIRRSTPAKLEFEIIKDKNFIISEGQIVSFIYKDVKMFYGTIFKYSFTNEDTISITAYDQLRYLKNKDTYVFENKTARQIISSICGDFDLQVGALIGGTGYSIPNYPCDNMSLYDIIEGALDECLKFTKRLDILYDDYGKITLIPLSQMGVRNYEINVSNISDFSFSSSIDEATYNYVKLYFNNEQNGMRDIYVEKDGVNIGKWGRLQLYEEVKKGENATLKAQTLLKLYNQPTRSLSISDAVGNTAVRAGSLISTKLDLGNGIKLCNNMLVDRCTHNFYDNDYRLELDLISGELYG